MPNFYPDIYKYLETLQNKKSVSTKDFDDMILRVRAYTGFDREVCADIVKYFFQEMRHVMLRGDQVVLRGFGKLHIVSPRTGGKRKIFPKFTPSKKILNKINEQV